MKHALIIDDNLTNLEVLAQMLAACDVEFTAIQDPTKLETVLQKLDHVDVVFLDLEMPKIDGYEMFGILKNILDPAIPVVACTVHLNEIGNARELGFDSFLGNPLKIDRFPQQLQRILNGEAVWEQR